MPRFYNQNVTDTPITTDELACKTPEYLAIRKLITDLENKQITINFAQNCIAASDIMQAALNNIGIKSRIVEVQLSLFRNVDGASDYYFVGYDNSTFQGQIDTHVVLITETEIPYLIDLSLGHMMPSDDPYIIAPLFRYSKEEGTTGLILEKNVANIHVTYTYKKNLRLANIHQKSILDRVFDDLKTKETLKLLKILCTTSICLGVINFGLNVALLIMKAIFK